MPPDAPRLSVVIPTHDTRELTLACLKSLARAGRPDTEILVVDDGSRDGTAAEIAARFPSVRLLRNERSQGFTRAANRGLEQARGEVLLLLNSDTEVEPAGLEALLSRFAAEPETGVIGAALHYPDGSPQWSGGEEPTLLWLFGLASGLPPVLARLPLYRRARPLSPTAGGPRSVGWVTGAALAIRREAWVQAGPLDERFLLYAQDLDLCLRVRQAGWEVEIVPELRVLHHHGATIGREAGSLGRQNPELLWSDLLRWARKNKGERWAAKAGRVMRWGVLLRLGGRRLTRPFLAASRREEGRADDQALRNALKALRSE
ncbi:MAG TPA: glycosyltransferase family 2 protein [Thermoanaerobaculia bacterium]|nr:glycosyltransferase family 2 protein [Thermoanaerobaculia bacterium]